MSIDWKNLVRPNGLALPFLLMLIVGYWTGGSRPAYGEPPIRRKIGVSLGLSGNLSSIGTAIHNAIALAQKENDPEGRIEFIFEDDGFDPKRTVTAVRKFLDQDKVEGLIIFGSGTALAVSEIAEKQQIPMIFLGNSKKVNAGKKYVMMHFLNTDIENLAVAAEVEKLPYKRIAVVCSSHEAMIDLSRSFNEKFPSRISVSLDVMPAETDFRPVAARVSASGSDAVYNILLPGSAGLFARQLRQLGFKGAIFSAHGVDDWKEVESSQGALFDSWFVTGNVIKDPGFVERYQAAYNDNPKVATPNGYDAAKLFIQAAQARDINSYLHQVKDFHGVMGSYGLNPEGYFELSAALRRITPSGIVPLH